SACFFFSSRRRHTRFSRDWNSDVCSSDLGAATFAPAGNSVLKSSLSACRSKSTFGRSCRFTPTRKPSLLPLSTASSSLRISSFRSEERRVGKEGYAPASAHRGDEHDVARQ